MGRCYKEGDTLIFQSDKGVFDTSVIIRKEIFYAEYNPIKTGFFRHQWGIVRNKNIKLEYNPEGTD